MNLVNTIKDIGKKTLFCSLILKSLAFGYDNIKSVTIDGPGKTPFDSAFMVYPNVTLYQTFREKGISDSNIQILSSSKGNLTTFPMPDQTPNWTGDDIWAGKDLFTYPDTVKFDRINSDVTAKNFLDDIVNAGTTDKDLLFIYLEGHGSLNTQPKDTYIRAAGYSGATTWQGLPLDSGKIFHYHINKALSMAKFKRCIILTDACNSYSLAQYIGKDKNLNNTNLQNVIAISASRGDLDGLSFGNYFSHLCRTGETIKRAVEITDSLNGIEQANIICYGDTTTLKDFTSKYNLFQDSETTAVKPTRQIPLTKEQTGIVNIYNIKGQLVGKMQNQKNNQKLTKYGSHKGLYITKIRD